MLKMLNILIVYLMLQKCWKIKVVLCGNLLMELVFIIYMIMLFNYVNIMLKCFFKIFILIMKKNLIFVVYDVLIYYFMVYMFLYL